jgi:hypothetical protein
VIGRLALRSLTAHPVRSLVLAFGFGAGVSVMAILLGVAEVVLQQAQSPALVGGGDVLIRLNRQVPAQVLLSGTLQADALRKRTRAVSPFSTTYLFMTGGDAPTRVAVRAGIPSLERALGDPETSSVAAWRDTTADAAWTASDPAAALRQVDRFHPIPDAPAWNDSWAEWLYFNGRGPDARFYLTFLVGPRRGDARVAGVRLQLQRGGRTETFGESATITQAQAAQAPDLTIGRSSVRLVGLEYHVHLDLADGQGRRAVGDLRLAASPGRLVPPIEISGANGWRTGYVVPVMSGTLGGAIAVGGDTVSFDGTGYHDHNWGFWRDVRWQWGQVQKDGLSLLYGRVFPPADAADPASMPGFVGVLGPDGPLGYATNVKIAETDDADGRPKTITIHATGNGMDVQVRFEAASAVTTRTAQGFLADNLDFLQLQGTYTVTGRAGGRQLDFTAPGAAETFRGAVSLAGTPSASR